MTTYYVTTESNGGEYEDHHAVTCNRLVKADDRTVHADGVVIRFADPIIEIDPPTGVVTEQATPPAPGGA